MVKSPLSKNQYLNHHDQVRLSGAVVQWKQLLSRFYLEPFNLTKDLSRKSSYRYLSPYSQSFRVASV